MIKDIQVEAVLEVNGKNIDSSWNMPAQKVKTIEGEVFVNTPHLSKHEYVTGQLIKVVVSKRRYGGYHTITPI